MFGAKFMLPVGSERLVDDKRFEEIVIPFQKAYPMEEEKLIKIDQMDDFLARGFKSYKSLNRVQSIVYPVAYGTNENMLICAPTGAVR